MANWALSFDGTASKGVTVPHISAYAIGTGNFTIEMWFKYSSAVDAQWFFDKGTGANRILIGNKTGGDGPSVSLASTWIVISSSCWADGEWHHFAVVRSGTGTDQTELYIDGSSIDTGTSAGDLTNTDQFALGNRYDLGANPFTGFLDDIRFWNVARTQTQIQNYRKAEIDPSTSGLVGYWKCNDGSGTSLTDSTSNANTGTLTATTPTWTSSAAPVGEYDVSSAISLPYALPSPSFSPYQIFPGTVSLPLSLQAPQYSPFMTFPSALSLPIAEQIPSPTEATTPSAALALALTENIPSYDSGKFIPTLALGLSFPVSTWYWDGEGIPIYRLYLTGSADATTDVELPMSTFTARIQSGEPTYVQVTVPDSTTYSAAVQARPNGEIVVYRGIVLSDGTEQLAELTRAAFETLSDDRGNTGASTLTLSGSKTVTTATPKTRTMTGLSYRRGGTNARRYRCSVDTHLKAGDTAIFSEFGDESITVGQIYLNVTVQGESMELEEAT